MIITNIYHKINFMAQNGSDLCNFYSKLDIWKYFYYGEKYKYSIFLNQWLE